MKTLRAIAAVVFVPAFGAAVALYILMNGAGEGWLAALEGARQCAQGLPSLAHCEPAHGAPGLLAISIAGALLGAAILIVFWLGAMLCGANRLLLAWIFPTLTTLTLIALAALTLIHAGIVGVGLFTAESYWLGDIHGLVLWTVVGFGALAALGVANSAVRTIGRAQLSVVGYVINPMDQPRLMLAVRKLARAVGATPPNHVVVGMDANFFVTHADVNLPGLSRSLRGRTLFLSVPLLRGLSGGELNAVIAHELSHFAHNDAAYSQRFAPIYTRLVSASGPGEDGKPNRNPFNIPVRAFTDFMVETFHGNVARISRTREFAADARSAQATSPVDLATALLKVSILTELWNREFESMIDRVRMGRFSRNLSRNFEDQIRYDLDRAKVADMMASVMVWQAPHPTDSHPTTEERVESLGLAPAALLDSSATFERFFGQGSAAEELDDLTKIEEALTYVFQRMLVDAGLGEDKEADHDEIMRRVLIDMIAHMIVVDGVVDEREIALAEREASALVSGFDPRDLRERCRHPDDLVDLEKLSELTIQYLTPKGFQRLSTLLVRIASADGMEVASERSLLARVSAAAELAAELDAEERSGAAPR